MKQRGSKNSFRFTRRELWMPAQMLIHPVVETVQRDVMERRIISTLLLRPFAGHFTHLKPFTCNLSMSAFCVIFVVLNMWLMVTAWFYSDSKPAVCGWNLKYKCIAHVITGKHTSSDASTTPIHKYTQCGASSFFRLITFLSFFVSLFYFVFCIPA